MSVWNLTGSMSQVRAGHTATLLGNGKVLVTGGYDENSDGLATCELYDPATGLFTSTGAMQQVRYYHVAILLNNGKVLVTGGFDATDGDSLTAELYDPGTGLWAFTGNFLGARAFHSTVLLPNGKVLLAGADGTTTSTHLYDPDTGLWTPTGSLAIQQSYPGAALLDSNQVLIAGGQFGSKKTELYNITAGTWAFTGDLNQSSNNIPPLIVLANGKALLMGGYALGTILSRAELYDPVATTWSLTGAMAGTRYLHTATLMDDGTVLVTGGNPEGGLDAQASCELYDSGTGVWTAFASMNYSRSEHTATRLADGSILVTGGISEETGTDPTSTAEIFPIGPATCREATALYILGTGWPILYDILTDPVEEIVINVEKKIVRPGTQRPVTGGFVDIYAIDKYRSIQISSSIDLDALAHRLPETFEQTLNLNLPPLLLSVAAAYSRDTSRAIHINTGFGSANVKSTVRGKIVTTVQDGYRGPAVATVHRTFMFGPPIATQTPSPLIITPASGTAYITTRHSAKSASLGTTGGFAYVELSEDNSEAQDTLDISGILTGSLGVNSGSGALLVDCNALAARGSVFAQDKGIIVTSDLWTAVNEARVSAQAELILNLRPSCPRFLTPGTTFLHTAGVEKWRFGLYVQTLIYVTIPEPCVES